MQPRRNLNDIFVFQDKSNALVVAFSQRNIFLEKEREEYAVELEQRRRDVKELLRELSDMHLRFSNLSDTSELNQTITTMSGLWGPQFTASSAFEAAEVLAKSSTVASFKKKEVSSELFPVMSFISDMEN